MLANTSSKEDTKPDIHSLKSVSSVSVKDGAGVALQDGVNNGSQNGEPISLDTILKQVIKTETVEEQEDHCKNTVGGFLNTTLAHYQIVQGTAGISDEKGINPPPEKLVGNDSRTIIMPEVSKVQVLQQLVQQQFAQPQFAQPQHISMPFVQLQQGITTYIPVDGTQGIVSGGVPYTGPVVLVGNPGSSLQTYKTVLPQGTQLITSTTAGTTRIVPANPGSTNAINVSHHGKTTTDKVNVTVPGSSQVTTSGQSMSPAVVTMLVQSNKSNVQDTTPDEESMSRETPIGADHYLFSLDDNTPDQLSNFAKQFRQRRVTLGFTQADVGDALGHFAQNNLSQTTICRFEALQLSLRNMLKLKPILERWLQSIDKETNPSKDDEKDESTDNDTLTNQNGSYKKRKRRTIIEKTVKSVLEYHFEKRPRPSSNDISSISESLNLEREVVRVWFCNRRQKERRVSSTSGLVASNEEGENNNFVEVKIEPLAS